MTLPEDRRRKRSNDPLVALHYQLAHIRSEGHFDAVVVADDAGFVVAAAGAWAACEELAAYAPLLARKGSSEPNAAAPMSRSRVAELGDQVEVQPVDVDGFTVLLCASLGAPRDSAEPVAMDRGAAGVARILRKAA